MANFNFTGYLAMDWTTDADECDHGCGTTMSHDSFYEGAWGHFCSRECARKEEPSVDRHWHEPTANPLFDCVRDESMVAE